MDMIINGIDFNAKLDRAKKLVTNRIHLRYLSIYSFDKVLAMEVYKMSYKIIDTSSDIDELVFCHEVQKIMIDKLMGLPRN